MSSETEAKERNDILVFISMIEQKFCRVVNPRRFLALVLAVVILSVSAMAVADDRMEGSVTSNGVLGTYAAATVRMGGTSTRSFADAAGMAPEAPEMKLMNYVGASDMVMDGAERSVNIGSDFAREYGDAMKAIPKPRASQQRMLVHDGNLSINARKGELTSLGDKIEIMVKESKGYIESTNAYKSGNFNNDQNMLDLRVKIPSDLFHSVVKKIQDFAGNDMITSISINSHDVTDQFIDANSRADTLDASRTALRTLMEKARNVNEVMNVQRELNQLTQQYESHKRSMQYMQNQADLSSLYVHIKEDLVTELDKPKPIFSPSRSLRLALAHVAMCSGFVVDTIIYSAVWVIPFCFVFFIVSLLIKKK